MRFSFSQAIEKLAQGCNSAIKSVQERVLPTPGKRKRSEEEVPLEEEEEKRRSPRHRPSHVEPMARAGSVNPPSQYAHAAAPPASNNDALTIEEDDVSTPVVRGQQAPQGHRLSKPSLPHFASPVPWQRRYPAFQQRPSPAHASTFLDIGNHVQFTPFARQVQHERFSMQPGSALWGSFHGHSFGGHRQLTHQNNLRERDALRQMTQAAMRRQPVRQERTVAVIDLEGSPAEPREEEPAWLQQRPPQSTGAELSVARFELELSKEDRYSEDLKLERERLKARCEELMGEQQARLLARASAALGEKRPAAHNAAAAISKASMEAARKEARALFGESSELAFLEEQQQRLAEMRGAQKEAASTIRPRHVPATKPAALQRRRVPSPQPEADFVDLVSSDEDEPQDDGDEAATRHAQEHDSEGEGSQSYPEPEEEEDEDGAEGSEEEEEESVRVKLLDVSVHDRKSAPHFPPLTKRQRELHRDALDEAADQETEILLHKGSNIGITRHLLACLKPRTWLNDEVMNVFMGLLQDRDKEWRPLGKYPACHFFNTFFFNKLYLDKRAYEYLEVSRWTRPKRLKSASQVSSCILDCDRIIIPVHLGVHWTCAMVDLQHQEFAYFDSLGGREVAIMESLQRYVADEYKDKLQQEVDTSSWPIRYPSCIPKQENGCDCGVFSLMFAEHLARGADDFEFQQVDMEYFRVMITAAIMDLKLISHFQ